MPVSETEEGPRTETSFCMLLSSSLTSIPMDVYIQSRFHNIQIMGNATEFHRAAQLVVDHVSFDRCTTVQVFEATIRYICTYVYAIYLCVHHQIIQ